MPLILTALSMLRFLGPILRLLPVLLRPPRPGDLAKLKQLVHEKFPDVKSISTSDLAQWLGDANRTQPVLIDVRSKEEFAVSHLKGALHRDPAGPVSADLSPSAAIVVYCAVGYRSAQFARRLQRQGFTNVRNLEGAIFQWANDGLPLYRGAQQVHQVHPYNGKWRGLLKSEFHRSPGAAQG